MTTYAQIRLFSCTQCVTLYVCLATGRSILTQMRTSALRLHVKVRTCESVGAALRENTATYVQARLFSRAQCLLFMCV
jgi:hypothetical protein